MRVADHDVATDQQRRGEHDEAWKASTCWSWHHQPSDTMVARCVRHVDRVSREIEDAQHRPVAQCWGRQNGKKSTHSIAELSALIAA